MDALRGGKPTLMDPPEKKNDPKANLLNAVSNQKEYDKLSEIDKEGFNAAAKKAGLPTKKIKAQSSAEYRTNTDRVATDGYRKSTAGSRIKNAASTIKKVVGTALFGGRKADGSKKRIGE